jgi:hypothetical protein
MKHEDLGVDKEQDMMLLYATEMAGVPLQLY